MTRKLLTMTIVFVAWVVSTQALWADAYEVHTDKKTYHPGDILKVRFKNNSTKSVDIPGNDHPRIYSQDQKLVAVGNGFGDSLGVEAGATHPSKISWSKGWWRWVIPPTMAPGSYLIKVGVTPEGSTQLATVQTSFVLKGTSDGLKLATDKPVYRSGAKGELTITLSNHTSEPVMVPNSAPWRIRKGASLVYVPAAKMMTGTLAPGQTRTYTWNKKGSNGKFAGAGGYTIEVGPVASKTLRQTVALTPSGHMAGSRRFPLQVGNQWVFERQGKSIAKDYPAMKSMRVKAKNASGWHKVTNLAGKIRWVRIAGGTLKARIKTSVTDAFQFNRPLGHEWDFDAAESMSEIEAENDRLIGTLKVGALNETVVTPAGRFSCTRVDMAEPGSGGYEVINSKSFWFAPGVGLVQYSLEHWDTTIVTYALHHAVIRGSDKKTYTIGLK